MLRISAAAGKDSSAETRRNLRSSGAVEVRYPAFFLLSELKKVHGGEICEKRQGVALCKLTRAAYVADSKTSLQGDKTYHPYLFETHVSFPGEMKAHLFIFQ